MSTPTPNPDQTSNKPRQMLFVLIGPTRSGKSTFINTVLGKPVAQEGKERTYHSCTREVANYCNMQLEPENQALLSKVTNSNEGEPPVILNFLDTIGLGDTSVTYTDEEIQELVKAELLTKTICNQIDGIIILENPNSPSIQINQTYYKILKIFGP